MTTSPVLASYKAPRKKKRKKHRYTSKPCLFLIPVMIGTFILLYSVRNSIHVSNKLFLKTLIMDVRETLIQHGSYYMHPGENDLDEIERYFMEEEEDDFDEEELNEENIDGTVSDLTESDKTVQGRNHNAKDDERAVNEMEVRIYAFTEASYNFRQ